MMKLNGKIKLKRAAVLSAALVTFLNTGYQSVELPGFDIPTEIYAFEGVYDPARDRDKLGEKTGPGIAAAEAAEQADLEQGTEASGTAGTAEDTTKPDQSEQDGEQAGSISEAQPEDRFRSVSSVPFDFGELTGSTFANAWSDMRITVPYGFLCQTGKEMYEQIYYEPQDAVYDGLSATDVLIINSEYADAAEAGTTYDVEDVSIFMVYYMPAVSAEGKPLKEDEMGTALAQELLGLKGYDAYVEKGERVIGGYDYKSFNFDYGYAVKTDYRVKNPGKDSPLLEDDIRARTGLYMRTIDDKEVIILTLTSGKYYGSENRISDSIRKISG